MSEMVVFYVISFYYFFKSFRLLALCTCRGGNKYKLYLPRDWLNVFSSVDAIIMRDNFETSKTYFDLGNINGVRAILQLLQLESEQRSVFPGLFLVLIINYCSLKSHESVPAGDF